MSDKRDPRTVVRQAYQQDLRPNERLIPMYTCDAALCGCEPVVTALIDCIPVATGMTPAGRYDRCLECGATWKAKVYRDDPSELIADPGHSIGTPATSRCPASAEMLGRYQSGASINEVAEEFDEWPSSVKRILERHLRKEDRGPARNPQRKRAA